MIICKLIVIVLLLVILQNNKKTSEDIYHFYLTANFISMTELQSDEMGGKYIVTNDVKISENCISKISG